MMDNEIFHALLVRSKQQFNTQSEASRQDILASLALAHATVAAYTNHGTDRLTGQPVTRQQAADALTHCIAVFDQAGLAPLADRWRVKLPDLQGTRVLSLELKRTHETFADTEAPGDMSAGLTRLMQQAAQLRDHEREKFLKENQKKIAKASRETLEKATPALRADLYASARFGTEPLNHNLSNDFGSFLHSITCCAALLAVVAPTPLTIGAAAGLVLQSLKELLPATPKQIDHTINTVETHEPKYSRTYGSGIGR